MHIVLKKIKLCFNLFDLGTFWYTSNLKKNVMNVDITQSYYVVMRSPAQEVKILSYKKYKVRLRI